MIRASLLMAYRVTTQCQSPCPPLPQDLVKHSVEMEFCMDFWMCAHRRSHALHSNFHKHWTGCSVSAVLFEVGSIWAGIYYTLKIVRMHDDHSPFYAPEQKCSFPPQEKLADHKIIYNQYLLNNYPQQSFFNNGYLKSWKKVGVWLFSMWFTPFLLKYNESQN